MRAPHLLTTAAVLGTLAGTAFAATGGTAPDDPDPGDPLGAVAAADVTVPEAAGAARIVVRREPGAPARVAWRTVAGTAAAGRDFDAGAGFVQFRPGERARTVEIGLRGGDGDEGAERFRVVLDAAPGLPGGPAPQAVAVTITG